MTTKTLTWVSEDLSPYESNGKTTFYINVAFDDDSTASLGKQSPDKANELREMLVALKGQAVEFGLEDKGKPNKKGQPSYKIKSFPGYEPPPGPFSFDAPSKGGSWYNSEAGVAFTQERMDRRTALMQAVAAFPTIVHSQDLLNYADEFYTWLRQTSGAAQPPASEGSRSEVRHELLQTSDAAVAPPFSAAAATPAASDPSSAPRVSEGEPVAVIAGSTRPHAGRGASGGSAEAGARVGADHPSAEGHSTVVTTGSPSTPTTTAEETSEGGNAAAATGKGSAATPIGHRPGCEFPGVSEFRKDEVTRMPAGSLRCTGCHVTLKESEVA